MTTRRTFFMAAPALAGSLASVTSTLARAAEEPPKQADFLFVQTAKGMTFDKSTGKLTLEGISPITIMFSDRPERIAANMRTAAFAPFWSNGKDSFLSDPPNADISILEGDRLRQIVAVLHDPVLEGDRLSYTVSARRHCRGAAGALSEDRRRPSVTPARRAVWRSPDRKGRMGSTSVLDHHQPMEVEVPTGVARRVGTWFVHELREILPPTIFFLVGFNLIVLTTKLLVADYLVAVGSFMLATAGALIVGKAVLVANAMPVIRRFDRAPLIQPILFKTLVYWAVVFIARLLEGLIEFWLVQGHPLGEFLPHLVSVFSWRHFAAVQIWILVLFLIYVTASEFSHLLGPGELQRLLFTSRPSELHLNRRQRVRELLRLSKLADAHSEQEFRDPTSSAHRQLVDIVRLLAR